MKILIINAGSSSLKYKLFVEDHETDAGLIEEIGTTGSFANHETALFHVCQKLDISDITAVGHRVVHGGNRFFSPTLMNAQNIADLKSMMHLAPLHNPANIACIEIAQKLLPHAKHLAIFDTAFHHRLPEAAYTYAIDRDVRESLGIRRYGFHGISHQYVSERACHILQTPINATELISLHLGNGASACAVQNGVSIETSMGMTPLEGLVMGTRSGDIDPAVTLLLLDHLGSKAAVDEYLNKNSGLEGLCGDRDVRNIERRALENDSDAKLALEVMIHRLIKYIGAYCALLPKLKAIIFTGGIGENSGYVRYQVLSRIQHFGINVDMEQNQKSYSEYLRLTDLKSPIATFAIRTNEELCMQNQIKQYLTS